MAPLQGAAVFVGSSFGGQGRAARVARAGVAGTLDKTAVVPARVVGLSGGLGGLNRGAARRSALVRLSKSAVVAAALSSAVCTRDISQVFLCGSVMLFS